MDRPLKFWVTLALGITLGVILSCIAAITVFVFEWNRKTINKENRIAQVMEAAGIKSGKAKILEIEDLTNEMTRDDVFKFMHRNKFQHGGSRVVIANLAELDRPRGYTEIFEANMGHPLCSFKYLVITYYDENSHFTNAKAAIHQNGCI